MMTINLKPAADLVKTFGVLAHVDEKERNRILQVPYGKFDKEVEALKERIEAEKFKTSVVAALQASEGHKGKAAKLMNISRTTLDRRITKGGIFKEVKSLTAEIKKAARGN